MRQDAQADFRDFRRVGKRARGCDGCCRVRARWQGDEATCANRKPDLWYGDEISNWQDCLEALMAGDFLTPTMIG